MALGLTSFIYLYWFTTIPLTQVVERLFNALNSFPLMAIPFFIFAGELMLYGGVADRIDRLAAGQDGPDLVDRVARLGHQHLVARVDERPRQVGDPLLGADQGQDLGVRVQLDPEAAPVEVGDRAPERRQPEVARVLVGRGVAGRPGQLLDHEAGGGQVGVADAEGDDVDPRRLALGDLAVDLGEQVGRDGIDAACGAHELGAPPRGEVRHEPGGSELAAYRQRGTAVGSRSGVPGAPTSGGAEAPAQRTRSSPVPMRARDPSVRRPSAR